MVGHLLEYHPAVEYMKRELDAGSLGETFYMYCQRLNLGVVRQQENAFWSLAPHDVSVILYLFGAEPTSIEARGQDFLQPGVEDVVFANLQFADGRMAHVHVSWLDPHKMRRMTVVGTEKMVVLDDMESERKLTIYEKAPWQETGGGWQTRSGDIHIPKIPGDEPLRLECEHFLTLVVGDGDRRKVAADGARVVRALDMLTTSLNGG